MASILGKKERIIWISIVIVMAVITIFVVNKRQTTLNMFNQKVLEFKAEKTTWSQKEANLNAQVADLTEESLNNSLDSRVSSNDQEIIYRLKEQGFDGKVEDIVNDLMKHKELIPHKGVLGGTMGFYSKENVHVLSGKWVFAEFNDGHICGYILLSYSINNGKISWKVIDSYI